ncbi:hypothetical protein [Bosea robiniae]|uniref:Uncharacterized protein n=1 Tax=Bosea robiniae TaxID=1036780 RepID=A0ABY0P077_9HYPH|nr:hypothetical protein [Bosea robiniae]SDG52216.1 hypothetical protein SAMN05421844_104240 [Bosea robiniae]
MGIFDWLWLAMLRQHVGRDTQTSARMREIRSPGLQRQSGLSVDVRTEIIDSPVLVDA